MTHKRVKAFLQIAEEDLSAATRLQSSLPRQAYFLLQQAVEKLIRATLEASEVPAGMAHNVFFLAGLLPEGHPLRGRFAEFENSSSDSTRYSYPTETGGLPSVSVGEVLTEVSRVTKLRDEVLAYLMAEGFR
jgi:hypothetical protein